MNIQTGYSKWDAACQDLIGQIQIASLHLGGQPVDHIETFRLGIARAGNPWEALAWEVAANNALDFDNWTACANATIEDLRRMSRGLEA